MQTNSQTLQLAIKYHRAKKFNKAEQSYIQVLKEQPQHPEALYGLGMLAQEVGQPQLAEKLFINAVSVQPELLKGWFSLGNVRQAQGQFPEAELAYQKAITLRPDAAALHNNLGYILQEQGKFDEAIACYQKALEIQPNCTEADVNWANLLHTQGKLSPDKYLHYAQVNYKLGVAREQAGDLQNAIIYYRQAIKLQPDFAEPHYHLGVRLQAQGELEAGIDCLQTAVQINPNYGEAYMCLGLIYQTQGKLNESAAAYRQGLKLTNPHYAAAINNQPVSEFVPEKYASPEIELGEVTVGDYQFPAIPPVPPSDEKRPFFSVIIPLYNRKDYMLECLASVLAQWQGEEEMEILVMDNASDPPLFELVNAIGGGIVRYYLNSENIGPRRNFNRGIALSRGEWIHLMPEDEYVLPGYYSRLKSSLQGCPDSVGAAFTGYENIDEKRKVVFTQKHSGMKRGINKNWLQRIGSANPLNPCATLIRRAAHERLGAYDLVNLYTPDWELYKRIASFYDWWCEPAILACYRQHSNNMSSEVFLAGAQAEYYRMGIEISESYLPMEYRAEITARSRKIYFNRCLSDVAIPLKADNVAGAFRLIQEALKIDSSPEAVSQLFNWLATEEAAPLRNAIASKLISQASNHNNSEENLNNFYFAYP
ncbi:MAG: tetratricopeptide repeat protein [Calothrix sp. MO_167.B12]|nr:tetratricopeptide repeat protein [Calothrix sp. MO_167.B12]